MGDIMSTIINATTTNGVVIQPDNSGSLVLQTNNGTTALTISTAQNSTFAGTVTLPTGTIYPLVSGTAVASTSGTSIDFTSIPSWVKRISILFNEVSLSGTSNYLIQIGNAGVETTGYISSYNIQDSSGGFGGASSTAGFILGGGLAAMVCSGKVELALVSGNSWVSSGVFKNDTTRMQTNAGSKTTSNTLTNVRITTVNGTDTFDAGSINILYE